MAKYNIIKMKFQGPIHLGRGRDFYDTSADSLQSDTLSSALAAIAKKEKPNLDVIEFLKSFSISSAFPFCETSNKDGVVSTQFFLPKTIGKINIQIKGQEEHQYRKKLKKIKFIERSIWERLNKGQALEIENSQLVDEYLISASGKFEKPMKHQISQRVSVSRDGESDAVPFYFDWTFFQKDAGLYCIVDAEEPVFEEIGGYFETLGLEGLGSDRSVGGGQFSIETATMEIEEPEVYDGRVLLSLYIPSKEEVKGLDLYKSRYSLQKRGGFMSGSSNESLRHLWKRSVYMVDCGSVLKTEQDIKGVIVDLTPQWNGEGMHPVFRSGKVFSLKMKE